LKREQSLVADSDAMGVATEIFQYVCGSAEGRLGVDHPVFLLQGSQESGECAGIAQRLEVPEKLQGAGGVSFPESLQYEASKASGEDFDREEESAAGGRPTFVVGRETAAGNDAVEVRMEMQVLAPAMEASAAVAAVIMDAHRRKRANVPHRCLSSPQKRLYLWNTSTGSSPRAKSWRAWSSSPLMRSHSSST
jgi:hypothetical protein